MATHEYSRTSSALSVQHGTSHTFTTASFTVPAGERFVQLKVVNPNPSSSQIYMRGNALAVFGGGGMYNVWKSDVSSIWTDGNGCSIEVHNSATSGTYSMRIEVIFQTEDLPTYTITTGKTGSGTLTANKSTAYQGQQVTLTPTPGTGYELSSYTKSPSSLSISNNKFTMPAQNVSVTANFTKKNYAISVVSEDDDMGTVTGGGTYSYQSKVTITAIAKPGYKFTGWTKTAGTLVSASSYITQFTVPASTATVTAHFERSQSVVGYYHNSTFEDCMVSYYDGSDWQDCDVYRYDGTSWEKRRWFHETERQLLCG